MQYTQDRKEVMGSKFQQSNSSEYMAMQPEW